MKAILLLLGLSLVSACGLDEEQASSCMISNFEGLGISSCQDLGEHNEPTRLGLEKICKDEGGMFEEKACNVTKGSPGCVNTVSVLNEKIKVTSWFDAGFDVSAFQGQQSEYCEDVIFKD